MALRRGGAEACVSIGAKWQKRAGSQHGLFWVAGRSVIEKAAARG